MVTTPAIPNVLSTVGLPDDELRQWTAETLTVPTAEQATPDTLQRDAAFAATFFERGEALLRRLPPKPSRNPQERAAAEALLAELNAARERFLRPYAEPIYAQLTQSYRRFVRVEELVYAAAERFPGLVPTRAAVQAEGRFQQKDKEGVEIAQGLFLAQVFAHPRAGMHLLHAMLRPTPEAQERLADFQRTGHADLGAAVLRRDGKAGHLYLHNSRFLNAEDDSTLGPLEVGVDLALLDPAIEVGVLRGATVEHPKYAGRAVFNAGLNLTHLYHGQISFLFFITREVGLVNKIYRGHSGPELLPLEPENTLEKPWLAAVEAFAIGGGCQLLLVMDHVLAEAGSFFNLPARKEGIIPGAANLRLPRFVGDRLTRQAIFFDRQFPVESPEARLLYDVLVPKGEMDKALAEVVERLTASGLVSAAGNRKAIRVGQEPLDLFRQYMSPYAREQAYCHYSPQLIRNLEQYWQAHTRQP